MPGSVQREPITTKKSRLIARCIWYLNDKGSARFNQPLCLAQVLSRFVGVLKRRPQSDHIKHRVHPSGLCKGACYHVTGSDEPLGFLRCCFTGFYAKAVPFLRVQSAKEESRSATYVKDPASA